jgi:flagellar hook-associated protein 2
VAQTILGINSNLDTGGILDNLIQLQRSPIDIVESKRALEDAKLLSFQDLRDRLQTFKGVVNSLNTEARFLSTKGEFSNNSATDTNSVLSLSTNSQASSGTFSLTVHNLARESKLVSAGFPSTSGAVTQGVMTLVAGTSSSTITIDSTNNTVDGLRLAINNSGLNIKASFLNDGSSQPSSPCVIRVKNGYR